MRKWKVAGGLISNDDGILLVANRRRDGRVDWSPPGGVVDERETLLGALSREVHEETGLTVATWSQLCWTTEVHFVDLEMHLEVEVHMATAFEGSVVLDDPDGIVQEAVFLDPSAAHRRLDDSPPWVAEPLRSWIDEPWSGCRAFEYRALGRAPSEMSAERIRP